MDLGIAAASHLGLGGWFVLFDDRTVVFFSRYEPGPQLVFAEAPAWVLAMFVEAAALGSARAAHAT